MTRKTRPIHANSFRVFLSIVESTHAPRSSVAREPLPAACPLARPTVLSVQEASRIAQESNTRLCLFGGPSLGLLFAPTCIFAQQQTTIPQKQERIEVLIAKTVVFITLVVDLDGRTIPGQGTGFLVAVPDARMGKDQGFIYLITNRHVAEAIDNVGGICRRYRILQTSVTWNLKSPVNGQRQHTETINNPPGLNWVFPEDDSVDLAAIPFGGDAAKYDVEFVSIADFITPELFHTQFDVGDKILFAGLFSPFEGANEIQPILDKEYSRCCPTAQFRRPYADPGLSTWLMSTPSGEQRLASLYDSA